jgi:hypothetical protein
LMESVSFCIFLSQVLSCLINLQFFLEFPFYLQVLMFCLLVVLVFWSGRPLCFVFMFHSFFWGFPYHGSLPL